MKPELRRNKFLGAKFKINVPQRDRTYIEEEHFIQQQIQMSESHSNNFNLTNKTNIMKQLNRQTQNRFHQQDEPKVTKSLERTFYFKSNYKPKTLDKMNNTFVKLSNSTLTNLRHLQPPPQPLPLIQEKKRSFHEGYKTTKTIKAFDCIQDLSDAQLLQRCIEIKGPHAKQLVYSEHNYIWHEVTIVGYQDNKFLSDKGQLISRLSLVFKFLDEAFQLDRVFKAKERMEMAQDDLRYLAYIESQEEDCVRPMSDSVWKKIVIRTRNGDNFEEEVKSNYLLQMKKCLVLQEMNQDECLGKFKDLRIRIRRTERVTPLFGTVRQRQSFYQYKYKTQKETLQRIHISQNRVVVKTLKSFQLRNFKFEDYSLFNTALQVHNLPYELGTFEQLQRTFHKSQQSQLIMQWREFLISEIQDVLKDTYRFYQTDTDLYQGTDLQRLIKRIDFMVNTFLRDQIFKDNLHKWFKFLQSFNNAYALEGKWRTSEIPLLSMNLLINLNAQAKKKKKEEEEPLFYFEPSFQQVQQVLLAPIQKIKETSEYFHVMEKDLVPLLDTGVRKAFKSEHEQDYFETIKQEIIKVVEEGLKKPAAILEVFSNFQSIVERKNKDVLKQVFGELKERVLIDNINIDTVRQELEFLEKSRIQVQSLYTNQVNCGFILVKTAQCKEILLQKIQEAQQTILQKIKDICIDNVHRILTNYQEMHKQMTTFPRTEKELVEIKNFIASYKLNIQKNQLSIKVISDFLIILEDNCSEYMEEDWQLYWSLRNWPKEIGQAEGDNRRSLQQQENKFQDQLEMEKERFQKELTGLGLKFREIKKFNVYENVKDYAIETQSLRDQIEKAFVQIKSFNEREVLFKQQVSEYQDLLDLNGDFEPFFKMWELAIDFDLDKQEWLNGAFIRLNYESIGKKLTHYLRQMKFLIQKFENLNQENALQISGYLMEDLKSFQDISWMIQFLTIEVMVKKHSLWKELFQKCSMNSIEPNDDMTLKLLMDLGMLEKKQIIEEFSSRVEKQYVLEKKLNEMVDRLKSIKVFISKYKNYHIIEKVDDIIQILDDNFNVLVYMKSSPYIKPVINKANYIEQRLILVQDTLDGWVKCQRSWMYLEPIFSSDDIRKKLPLEHRKFEAIDRTFKNVMENYVKDPHLWESLDSDKIKKDFEQANKMLDTIQKSLQDYLETKRKVFPRFFFLSDDQLLEILAQTKDPQMVQRHIGKCFEAINDLQFRTDSIVNGMNSPEREQVKFSREIDVNHGEKKGQVEIWLLEIEDTMRFTLRQLSKDCFLETDRTKRINDYPAMTVLSINMINWSKGVENALDNEKLEDESKKLELELQGLVQMVRGGLGEQQTMTLASVVVLDVHNRDVVETMLKENVSSKADFTWISQMRYYYKEEKKKVEIDVKCINSVQSYGFEYLGNSTRLVITPLTDRCYRTLMGAYQMFYGGAPEGPAGTGKTETTKDLAKAVAVYCIVFNCSDQLNYQSMSKFFKGLASSGAWCCFDEFNRIDLEVLSVIAQQVITIQQAVKEKKTRFFFEGEELALIPCCNVNITMNPGYAGRSELPDNLKVIITNQALFRTVAMMVPNYQMIAEIYLYSKGFEKARLLATKIVASLQLCGEQLSSQFHYDFGMRALKAILQAAGDLKRVSNISEDQLALKVLHDVNLPKFTKNDIPLFKSITSDLFPNMEDPRIPHESLIANLTTYCEERNLIANESFLQKCIQLYDIIAVRHGVMVIGEANSGKTSVLDALSKSMEGKVTYKTMNPKSIFIHQLYGMFDADTKTWTDGILPLIMRQMAGSQDSHSKWIVFDGPVDAVWIESMNTVLDDNKKLCLTSGEIIKLTESMKMLFETEDLQHASPATVSRCGMVFLESINVSWHMVVETFFKDKFPARLEEWKESTISVIEYFMTFCAEFNLRHAALPLAMSEVQICKSFLNLFKYYISPFEDENNKISNTIEEYLQNAVLFSMIWSWGGIQEDKSRPKFNQMIASIVQGQNTAETFGFLINLELPKMKLKPSDEILKDCYSISFQRNDRLWMNWLQTEPIFKPPNGGIMQDLIIPTNDSIRFNKLLNIFIEQKSHLLVVGPTGTGKTVNVSNELSNNYFNEEYTYLITQFSGKTSCNQAQKTIESKMNTKRRKGRFGPEDRKSKMVLFVDDFNMPTKETYMAQPPIEIVRQWMDLGGWYDLDTKEWKYLEDIIFTVAMGPPSQGRNSITKRCSRHFNVLYSEPQSDGSLRHIFGTFMEWFFDNGGKSMGTNIRNIKEKVVDSTIQIYNLIKLNKQLLPTPAKSHYVYNLRDLAKVFYGIGKVKHYGCSSDVSFIKLWAHECSRVFQDRLIDKQDQDLFQDMLKDIMQTNFNKKWDQVVEVEPLIWTSLVQMEQEGVPKSEEIYWEQDDLEHLKQVCVDKLYVYNQNNASNQLNLVLFMNAIEHIIRIYRIINFPQGHGLLIGVGGSGRKSLAMLSGSMGGFQILQIDSKNWTEELQKMLRNVGLDQRPSVFIFSDIQAINEQMYEDISNLLNNGEVPNLYSQEEKLKIVEEVNSFMPIGTMNQKYAYFVQKCKENLHLMLCMSPVGNNLRKCIRTFPGMVNCTTIDWYLLWPEEALVSIARTAMQQVDVRGDSIIEIKESVVRTMVSMQKCMRGLTAKFYQEFRRYYYVTPTSYLNLIDLFKHLHNERQVQIYDLIQHYTNGLDKLRSTEDSVSKMQETLENLQPILQVKNEENAKMLVILQEKQKEANASKAICAKEEEITNAQKQQADTLKESCENDLKKVLPLLEEASRALDKIKQEDITLIKSFVTPPSVLDLLMQSVVVALGEETQVKFKNIDPNDPSKGKVQDFWDYAKKFVLNNKLIKRIQTYKVEKIKSMNPKNIDKMKKICDNPDFSKEKVFKVSEPAGNLSLWIRACTETFDALLVVEPKRLKLAEAQKSLAQAELILGEKQAELKAIIDVLDGLEESYRNAIKEKQEVEHQVITCEKQLDRAQKLIVGLVGEKTSWSKKQQDLILKTKDIVGDVLLSSAFVTYLGPFYMQYRDDRVQGWSQEMTDENISFSPDFTILDILCDASTIGIWVNQHKLPNDRFSIENAIISHRSKSWSLMIDPQIQANGWIKQKVGRSQIKTIKITMTQQEIVMMLEGAIMNGQTVLLENVGEEIDHLYDDILAKNLVEQSGKLMMKFGERLIDYDENFRFFMTSKLSNPHYPPEICVKVTLLNFMVTPDGLEDQMLNIVIKIEEPNKDEQRQRNVKEFFEYKEKQQQTEDKILKLLSESSGNILDDEELINALQESKVEGLAIEEKIKLLEINREQFKNLQNFYKDAAKRSSNLYFAVQDLAHIEPVYQFSLEFFIEIFEKSVEKAPSGRFERIKNIKNSFTGLLYENIIRSLLEKDKLTFSLLLCMRIMQFEEKKITAQEIRFLFVGGTAFQTNDQCPVSDISQRQFAILQEMAQIPGMEGVLPDLQEHPAVYTQIMNVQEPYQSCKSPFLSVLNGFQKLLILRILRPDKLLPCIQGMIIDQMEKKFIEQPYFDLNQVLEDSNHAKPLIFILSTGADPRNEVENIAKRKDMSKKLIIKSMGQGQGEAIKAAIDQGKEQGLWVFLQNCHLAKSFMPALEQIFERLPYECHKDFRLWLTLAPFGDFPVTIMQRSVKLTYEPPKGIKNSLKRSYNVHDWSRVDTCSQPVIYKKMLFGLSFFHAMVLERRKFGPLGWNVPYDFSSTDLEISVLQLGLFLDQYSDVQWPALNYLVAEANYGGRVTDDKDRRLIKVILEDYYTPKILEEAYKFSESGTYHCPEDGPYDKYKGYILGLPLYEKPEVFGLHDNAEISAAIHDANKLCDLVLSLLPRSTGGQGLTQEQIIQEKCREFIEQVPQEYDLEQVNRKFPILYEQSMNTVLQQEMIRFNTMIKVVRSSLTNLDKAIDGLVSMSQEIDEVSNALFDNKVPDLWAKVAYPSVKPLATWFLDFLKRLAFIQKWYDEQQPSNFWVSGFYFPQSFLTGVLQNYSRKYKIPIDTLGFDYFPIEKENGSMDVNKSPENGCLIHGLYLDGCKWNSQEQALDEQDPKVLYVEMVFIYLKPLTHQELAENQTKRYNCPVYKTSTRRGTLTTTGHSTNFVLNIQLPIQDRHSSNHWIKRGVAMLTQLDE